MNRKDRVFEHCAGMILCEPLPKNWQEMEQSKLEDFMESNPVDFYEGAVGAWLFKEINENADAFIRFQANEPKTEMIVALEVAAELIKTARQYFPKSVKHTDTFHLELACATIGTAIENAEGKI